MSSAGSRPRRVIRFVSLAVVYTGVLAGCGGSPSAEKTVTVIASNVTSSPTPTGSSTLAYPNVSATPDATSSAGVEAVSPTDVSVSTGPPVIRNQGAPKSLTLADIFDHDGWKEGLYQTPQSATPAQAMGTQMGCFMRSLEVRFAQATGKAVIKVAQALDSSSSKVIFEFKLFSDQRLVDTKLVKFNQLNTLTTSIDGVSALTLEVRPAEGSDCSATAVVTEFQLTPQ